MAQDVKRNKKSRGETQPFVLLVEDEPSAREASKLYLGRLGYRVVAAANAEEALRQAANQNPDIVVCDWRLGDGPDGVDVARALQERYHVPVVFVTAHPIEELREVTRDLDVSTYMRKPISLPALAETIANVTG